MHQCVLRRVWICAQSGTMYGTPPGIRLHLCTTARSVNARRKTTTTIQHRYPHARDPIRVQTGWALLRALAVFTVPGDLANARMARVTAIQIMETEIARALKILHMNARAGRVVVLLASRTPTPLHLSICGRRSWRRQVQSRQPWLQQLRFAAVLGRP